jgi:hypothetical protein
MAAAEIFAQPLCLEAGMNQIRVQKIGFFGQTVAFLGGGFDLISPGLEILDLLPDGGAGDALSGGHLLSRYPITAAQEAQDVLASQAQLFSPAFCWLR